MNYPEQSNTISRGENIRGIRALFLTKYSSNGASSRYRTYQYIAQFEKFGMICEIAPLFSSDYLQKKYQKNKLGTLFGMLVALFRRLLVLGRARNFDVLVVEKEVIPYFPSIMEKVLVMLSIPYVVDYDDALFHQYDSHRIPLIRKFLGQKIAKVMRNAKAVVAGNNYIYEYAQGKGANNVEKIPTTVVLSRYDSAPLVQRNPNEPIVVGWIGSPSTAKYLTQIEDALLAVSETGPLKVLLIGCGDNPFEYLDATILPWTEETEIVNLKEIDIGIMPLTDSPWERGKCGLKLIQYMACAIPVVASPVGANNDIVSHGKTGYLANSTEQWVEYLERLRGSASHRRDLGRAGRYRVEEDYSMERISKRLAIIIAAAAAS